MRRTLCAVLLGFAASCQKPAVAWQDPMSGGSASDMWVGAGGKIQFGVVDADWEMHRPSFPTTPAPCPGSMVSARHGPFVAWWSIRGDSNAVLYAARYDRGKKAWTKPAVVDSGDVSKGGCNRPPPAIAVQGQYVHVVYSMQASEGTGVFLTHSMDNGVTFHATVPVIYGDRVVPAAVAADSQFVVVAYEQPNGTRKEIGLSISRSEGHLFETYSTASTEVEPAFAPRVLLADSSVAVFWYVTPGCTTGGCAKMMRLGHII